jgi:thiol:disulfide interchange protein DsbD
MGRLRRRLALPMLAAALWLAWVFAHQAGFVALTGLVAAGALLAFSLWLWGHRQKDGLSSRGDWVLRVSAALLVVIAGGWLAAGAPGSPPTNLAAGGGAPSQPYSAARLAALRAEGKPVFVNFTADWCVSCKVNERVALSGRKVEEAFERTGVVYLKGDWTNRDAEIARALDAHGRSGVPLYLVYGAGSAEPVILPQLLTEGAVIRALEEAAATTQAAE